MQTRCADKPLCHLGMCLLQGYLDYIDALPHVAPPGVFGLHDNADITKDLQEAQQLLDGLLLSAGTSATSSTAAASNTHNSRVSCLGDPTDADAASSTEAAGGDAAAAEAVMGAAKSREDVIAEIAADILAQLPAVFDLEAAEAAYPQDYFNSINTVLVQVRPSFLCMCMHRA